MKLLKFITAFAGSFALLAAPTVGAEDKPEQTRGEIKLAKMLEGRVAGEPQSCIQLRPTIDLTIIEGTALVYKSGRTLYVNLTNDPDSIDDDDALVRRSSSGLRLCRTDIITTVDRFGGHYTGNISLIDFVPYRKASDD